MPVIYHDIKHIMHYMRCYCPVDSPVMSLGVELRAAAVVEAIVVVVVVEERSWVESSRGRQDGTDTAHVAHTSLTARSNLNLGLSSGAPSRYPDNRRNISTRPIRQQYVVCMFVKE